MIRLISVFSHFKLNEIYSDPIIFAGFFCGKQASSHSDVSEAKNASKQPPHFELVGIAHNVALIQTNNVDQTIAKVSFQVGDIVWAKIKGMSFTKFF